MEALSFESVSLTSAQQPSHANTWHILPVYSLALHAQPSPRRYQAEQFIYQRFLHQYGARIGAFLPFLLSANIDGAMNAALGFQVANDNTPLFLEQYLDLDIETTLMLMTQSQIRRDRIVEIGNLASGRQRATQTLFLLLAQILYGAGYEWVVFTANRAVLRWLHKLEISAIAIQEADPDRLNDKDVNWGSYYDDRPMVLAAHIQHSVSRMNSHPLMAQLRHSYQNQITQFEKQLSA